MNPTLLLIIQKNSADIEAIVNKIGVGTLISLAPYFLRIAATLQGRAVPTPLQGQVMGGGLPQKQSVQGA